MKLIFMRLIQGMFIIIGLFPIYRLIQSFVIDRMANYPQLSGGIGYLDLGVSMVPFIIMTGVGIGCVHAYYRAVKQRQSETPYPEEQLYSDNDYR